MSDPGSIRRRNCESLRSLPAAREVQDTPVGPSRRSRGSHSPRHGLGERGEDDAADVIGDVLSPVEDGLVVQIRLLIIGIAQWMAGVGFAGDGNARLGRFDENRPRSRLNRLLEVRREPVIPTAPQRRLIGQGIESQFFTKLRLLVKILEQGHFVVPAVEYFEQEDLE